MVTDEGSEDANSVTSDTTSVDPPAVKRLRLVTENEEANTYVCAKCPFTATERLAFLQHIRSQHLEDNTAQCLECGLCFSSLSSLKKHLYLVHKVIAYGQK